MELKLTVFCTFLSSVSIFLIFTLINGYLETKSLLLSFSFSHSPLILRPALAVEDSKSSNGSSVPLDNNTATSTANTLLIEKFVEKGHQLLDAGRYQEAVELLDKALKIDGSNTDAIAGKGRLARTLGNYQEAIGLL